MDDEFLHGQESDSAYLRDLSNRLMHVPVMYGIDGFDIDCLAEMAGRLEAKSKGSDNFEE